MRCRGAPSLPATTLLPRRTNEVLYNIETAYVVAATYSLPIDDRGDDSERKHGERKHTMLYTNRQDLEFLGVYGKILKNAGEYLELLEDS